MLKSRLPLPASQYAMHGIVAGITLSLINTAVMLTLAVTVNTLAASAFLPILGWTSAVSFFAIVTDIGACIGGGLIGGAVYGGSPLKYVPDPYERPTNPKDNRWIRFPHNIPPGIRATFFPTLPLEFFMIITYFIIGIVSLFVGQTWVPVVCYGFQVVVYILNGVWAGMWAESTYKITPTSPR